MSISASTSTPPVSAYPAACTEAGTEVAGRTISDASRSLPNNPVINRHKKIIVKKTIRNSDSAYFIKRTMFINAQ